MEYQIGFLETLYVMLFTGELSGTLLLIFIHFILPLLLYRYVPNRFFRGLIIFVYVVLLGLSLFPMWGSGWSINGDKFHIKSYFSSDDVEISVMKIGFVDSEGEWNPKWREIGAGTPGAAMGFYRLKNNEQAIVFIHYYQRKLLLIEADKKYYLIGHPGIKELYDKLIHLGAQPKDFEK